MNNDRWYNTVELCEQLLNETNIIEEQLLKSIVAGNRWAWKHLHLAKFAKKKRVRKNIGILYKKVDM